MDFAALESLIETALATSPFTVSGAGLGSADITTLFSRQLGSDGLSLTDASRQSGSASSIVVQGTLTGPWLGASNLAALATFIVVDGTAEVTAVVTGFPPDWTLPTAFPALQAGWLDSFSCTDAQFTLDSVNASRLPAGFPSQYGMPAYGATLAAELVPGLSFRATLAPKSGGDELGWLLGGTQWTVSGPIELFHGLPSVLLAGAPGAPIALGSFSVAFAISLVAALVQPADAAPPTAVTSCLQADADIDIALTHSTLTIPVYARSFSRDLGLLTIGSNLSGLASLVLDDITTLIAGGSTAGQIPDAFPALDQIGLQSIAMTVVPASRTLVSASATIALDPGQGGWSVFDGLITFQGLTVTFTYLPSSATSPDTVETSVDCTAQIAGGTLTAGIKLPEMYFSCTLEAGNTIDISSIVSQITGGSVAMPEVACTQLNFFGTVAEGQGQGQYRFQASVTDDWVLTIPGSRESLSIAEVGMDLTYVPGQQPALSGLSGEIIGTFTVAGAPLYAMAQYDGASGGWIFQGGTQGTQAIDLRTVVDDALKLFGLQLPSSFPSLTLSNLNITYNTATHAFALLGMASVTVAGVSCDIGVEISTDTGSTVFNGTLWLGDDAFDLDFSTGASTVVAGSWVSTDASPSLSLNALVAALNLGLPALPSSIDLTATGADIVYDFTSKAVVVGTTTSYGSLLLVIQSATLLGLSIAAKTPPLNLTNLPLVGAELAKIDTIEIDGLQIAVANGPLATAGAELNALLDNYKASLPDAGSYAPFPTPAAGATTQAMFSATFDYGSGTLPIALPLDGGSIPAPSRPALAAGRGAPAPAAAASGGTTCFNIEKSFGPVAIERIGVLYQSDKQSVWFEIDATLAFGPLSLSLQGLGLGSPLTSFAPTFDLQGFGVAYQSPPVALSGALVNLAPPGSNTVQFEGELLIAAADFTVQVLGYYGNNLGFPSMFIFGDVAHDFGGPPAFFVTGVALGFGYNSSLTLPTIDQVATFPFVEVLPTSTFSQPNVLGGSTSPLTVLNTITGSSPPWVSEVKGDLWIAAGITFTSFELVNSQALLIVEAGSELVIALVGTSSAQFPQGSDVLYANIDLELELRFAPEEGVFSVQAALAPSSFVIDKACALTGGFAYFLWYGASPHAGDFVLTLGGYNPGFTPPSHYPVVPEVGFHWTLDSSISIQGGAYLALTPAVMMAGVELDATYQSGNLKAWFIAHADAIIRWKPYWMDVDIGVVIGASYVLSLAGVSKTVSVELGCDLEFWGPPSGGTAAVNWNVISFTISFGQPNSGGQSIGGWSDVEAMLPNAGTSAQRQILSLKPISGLILGGSGGASRERSATANDNAAWSVRGGSFGFSTGTPVPASLLTIGATSFAGSSFDVYPLHWTGVTATHAIAITDAANNDCSAAFDVAVSRSSVPASLWGAPPEDQNGNPQTPAGDRQLVTGQITGAAVTVKPPSTGGTAGPVDVGQELDYESLELPGAVMPLSAAAVPTGDVAANSQTSIGAIAAGIASSAITTARNAVLGDLTRAGYAPDTANDPLTGFADQVGHALAAAPLLVA